MNRKDEFTALVSRFLEARSNGQLQDASEETVRMWINDMLGVFGWDVSNTRQVMQERTLERSERERLHNIGSRYVKPDYTMMNGNSRLFFIDAKKQSVDIMNDGNVAFQIRSYGWSIGAPYSIVTDFEELAIYDCTAKPNAYDSAEFARLHYLTIDQYVENFELLERYLNRENVFKEFAKVEFRGTSSLDKSFALFLCDIRLELAQSMRNNNHYEISVSDLNLWTQIILNRILFIRVCEAKGLEEDGLLQGFLAEGFWKKFKESSYLDFYEHYDGPMFERLMAIHNLEISNDIFAKLLTYLYYPSPYCFDVIPLKSISDIYDIFLGYHLIEGANGNLSNALKSEFKKSNGAVTTPMPLVKDTINATLRKERFDAMSVNDILTITMLDPACGSGVFLAGMYDYIEAVILEKIKDDPTSLGQEFYKIIDGEPVLNIYGKKHIVSSCLFGIDINQESVEVAKLSLSLKIIDGYNLESYDQVGLYGSKILNGVGENVKCGNTLVSPEILSLYPSLIENSEELEATNIFNWEEAFSSVSQAGGFDYVIGNPPYVEVKNYNVELPTMASFIKYRYKSSKNGKIDLAIPFIERGLEFLNPNGSLGFLVQKRFFKTDYGKGIRRIISENHLLRHIHDYEETDLFEGRITYVAILVCDKSSVEMDSFTYISSNNNDILTLPKDSVSETPWNFDNPALTSLRLSKQQSLGCLSESCNIKVGVQVLWDPAYHINVDRADDKFIYGSSTLESDLKLEKDACRPLMCNEHFIPLSVRPENTFIIFPYDVEDGRATEIKFSDFKVRFPFAASYLSRNRSCIESEVQTLPVKCPTMDKDENWHLFTRANNHNAVYRKLCVPMTTQEPQAAVVNNENAYCDNANMFFIQIDDITDERLYAMAGIINSTPFAYFAKSIANPQQNGYYKFNKQFLDPVPFPVQSYREMTTDMIQLANVAKQIEQLH
ncbi:MAG: BREX-1 system adenine-specific DNA-methyltransferase PglX, partial [Muribaculum sp.]|nr:BREX-1 system adenine-specific DNA-methyltransferase PglX [Muribaculum sp.]